VAVVSGGAAHGFTVTLDVPPAVDTVVDIAVQPASLGTAPAQVTVAANTLSAKFDFTAAAAAGEGQVVATLDGQSASSSVRVDVPTTDHVVISEIAPAGPSNPNDEFIELYNPTSQTVNLAGWKVQYKSATGANYLSFTLPSGSSIAPKGYFLVGSGSYAPGSGPASDASWGTAYLLAQSTTGGGHVRIGPASLGTLPTDAAAVDTVGYGTANTPEGTAIPTLPAAAGSFERKASASSTAASMQSGGADALKGNAHDSNNNAADFILRSSRNPQSRASPTEQ
jgi:hypothetical protein